MSREAVNFILDKYSIDSGVFKIYYDFENYGDGGGAQSVLSEANADSLYSGRIYGDVDSFTGSYGSGNFNSGYVKVQNADVNLNSGANGPCTFLFSTKKSNTQAGVVFSNFGKNEDFTNYYNPTSGWEIGFNQANKLYFRNYNRLQPTILTLNSIPTAENIYAVNLSDGDVVLSHYNPVSAEFNVRGFGVDGNFIRPSYDWYLGTGEHQYQGYMDKFLYFAEDFGPGILADVSRAIFQDTVVTPEISGSGSTLVTGYEPVPSGTTGVLYYTGVLSGTTEFSRSGYSPTGTGITGFVDVGETYYELIEASTGFLNNNYPYGLNLYRNLIATSPGVRTTSITTGTSGFVESGFNEVYMSSGVTGITSTGTGYNPLSGSFSYVIQRATTGVVDSAIHKYLPDTVSYIGIRGGGLNVTGGQTGDFMEIQSGINHEINNKLAGFGYMDEFQRNTYFIESGSGLSLFLNGIEQFEGVPLVTQNEMYEDIYNVKSGDFFQSGAAAFQNTFESSSPSFNTDEVLYDVEQFGQKGQLHITGASQYAESPFSQISPDETQVFLNGQKIYSGIDYKSAGGLFRPTGLIVSQGLTGIFTTVPIPAGGSSLTGINRYDHNFSPTYTLNSLNFYMNGVRQNPDQFIQHSTGVDLIETGINIMEPITTKVYNINGGETLIYSSGDYWDG